MGIFEAIGSAISEAFSFVGDMILNALSLFFGKLLYYLVSALCYIVQIVYEFFSIFAGTSKIEYNGEQDYLLNVFFGNKAINNVYWGMALIGFVFIIFFTILALIKKMFDLNGRNQRSLGMVLGSAAKSFLIIICLSAAMSATLNLTNTVVNRVTYIFMNANNLDKAEEMDFTDEQYATMARIFNTIGNYSLNASYNSRYNLNSCYNELRSDLLLLQAEGVFDFDYTVKKGEQPTWQSKLQEIFVSRDPRYEIKIDDKNTVPAILDVMEILKTNESFYPLKHVEREVKTTDDMYYFDRIVFLMGTLDSANNAAYNVEPNIEDAVRGPFYTGQKDIYSFSDVSDAFDTSLTGINYVIIILLGIFSIKNFLICIFNCIARIFNLLGLYVVAPPIISTMPLDDGAKFKQWMTAMIVQLFSIFGNIIPIRLVILFMPVMLNGNLVLFGDSALKNMLAKVILIIGSLEAANRFSGILNGILTDMAGRESAQASDMRGLGAKTFGLGAAAVGGAASVAATVSGAKTAGNYVGSKIAAAKNYMEQKGGIIGGGLAYMRGEKLDDDKKDKDGGGNKELPQNLRK